MKIACITTTINVPRVLALYARHNPDVWFFIAGDRKTPDAEVIDFLDLRVPNHNYYSIDVQYELGYRCARLIPGNCIQRRNIALLEAVRWGADIIVSIDDDNIPLNDLYFWNFERPLVGPWAHKQRNFNGLRANSLSNWFDVGTLLQPRAPHRGFPIECKSDPYFEAVTDARIGVAAGICLGDPDISAVERIANGPTVHGVSEILRSGVVTDPRTTWTVFNSQNTAFLRELAPAMFMAPGVGRFDDIYASLICQRVMRERGLHVHFGHPFVLQQRNQHNLIHDLRQEIDGMENVWKFAEALDNMERFAVDKSIARQIWERLDGTNELLPKETIRAALAFCDDVEVFL